MKPIKKKSQGLDKTRVKNIVFLKKEMLSVRGLIAWITKTLEAEINSFDDLRTGAIYCQILHRLFPNAVMLKKVRMFTMYEFEFEANFRLLTSAFTQLGIEYDVPVTDLIRGPGNYNFCNWLYQFYVANDTGNSYDAKVLRDNSKIGLNPAEEKQVKVLKRSRSFDCTTKPPRMEQPSFRRSGSFASVFPRCKNSKEQQHLHPEVSFCAESKDIELPPDSDADDNGQVHRGGAIQLPTRRLTNNARNEAAAQHAAAAAAARREDSLTRQELQILHLRKEYRDNVETLDTIKGILLENPNNAEYSLNQIKTLLFINSESDSGIENI